MRRRISTMGMTLRDVSLFVISLPFMLISAAMVAIILLGLIAGPFIVYHQMPDVFRIWTASLAIFTVLLALEYVFSRGFASWIAGVPAFLLLIVTWVSGMEAVLYDLPATFGLIIRSLGFAPD